MRQITLGAEFFGPGFDPVRLTAELERQGFKFIRASCPVKFAGKVAQVEHDDGSVTFTQTEAEQ